MCLAGTMGKIINPFGLPAAAIDPGGSLVGMAVKATGVKGNVGAIANAGSGLEGTLDEGKSYYDKNLAPKVQPAATSSIDPATQTPMAQAAALNARNRVASLSQSPMSLTGAMDPNQFAAPALIR